MHHKSKANTAANRTAAKLARLTKLQPTLAMVLGSGFHQVLREFDVDAKVAYADLPGFPPVGVAGHSGELLAGRLGRTPVLILSGRAHYYEGLSLAEITFPIRVLAAFGITDLLLTNAAGGIRPSFKRGDFMVLTDHINLLGSNPLRGPVHGDLPRFVDMTQAYDSSLRALLLQAGKSARIMLHSGVYLAVPGPSYETPAEIRAFATLGADAVGMSTVPETIVARQCGLAVAGLSCITNLAAGCGPGLLHHSEVIDTVQKMKTPAARLLHAFAQLYERTR
jgi:purine-nucleoside phosphorylase